MTLTEHKLISGRVWNKEFSSKVRCQLNEMRSYLTSTWTRLRTSTSSWRLKASETSTWIKKTQRCCTRIRSRKPSDRTSHQECLKRKLSIPLISRIGRGNIILGRRIIRLAMVITRKDIMTISIQCMSQKITWEWYLVRRLIRRRSRMEVHLAVRPST